MNNPANSNNNNNNNSNSNNRGPNPNHVRSGSPNRSGPHHRSRKFYRGSPKPTGGPNLNPNQPSTSQSGDGQGPRDNRDGRNQQQRPHHQGGGRHRPPHHRSHHPHHRNHQGGHHHGGQQHGGGGIEQILIQYDKLVDQHIEARRKFHELYYRCDNNRLNKLEDQFYLTAQRITKFERDLRPWQLEQLKKQRTEIYPLDNAYSSAHPEAEKNEITSTDKTVVVHYHLTPDQLSRPSFKDDTEMSMGTIEDYLKYKNQA